MQRITVFAIASFTLISAAFAGEMEGTIKEVDMEKKMITLEDGTSVMTGDTVKLDGMMAGDKVKIMTGDDKMATSIEKM